MIDLSALGLAVAQTPHHTGKQQKGGHAHGQADGANSFSDLVGEAGRRGGRKGHGDKIADAEAADAGTTTGETTTDRAAVSRIAVPRTANDKMTVGRTADDRTTVGWIVDGKANTGSTAGDKTKIGRTTDDSPKAGHAMDVSAKADPAAADGTGDDDGKTSSRKLSGADLPLTASDPMSPVEASTPSKTDKDDAEGRGQVVQPQGQVSASDDLRQLLTGKVRNEMGGQTWSDSDDLADQPVDGAPNVRKNDSRPLAAAKDATPAAGPKMHSDPAQELRAMLEPARNTIDDEDTLGKTDVKPARKDKADDQVDDGKDTRPAAVANDASAAIAKTENPVIIQVTPHHAGAQDAPTATPDKHAEVQVDAGPKIQVVSADGKMQASDIDLPGSSDSDSTTSADSEKADFVTVLDARRYLGFSNDAPTSANANALTNAIKTDPSLAQLLQDVKTGAQHAATNTEVNTLKLQMSPEHLGNMTASLRLKGDELSVELRVETADAYRQLSQDHDGIVKALKEHGFSIDQVSIQLAPSARSDTTLTGGNQNQSGNGQQSLQDGNQGDTARQRDDGTRRNANQNNWTGNERTASFGDTGNSTDDTRSGNLYL